MSKADASDVQGNDAGEWAKTVMDGVPDATVPPAAPPGNVAEGGVPEGDVPEGHVAEGSAAAGHGAEPEGSPDDEVIDAELVDSEPEGSPSGEGSPGQEDMPPPAGAAPGSAPPNGGAAGGPRPDGEGAQETISVEDLVLDLERVTNERDQYLDASRRLQAEFENYKKQVAKREATARERANDSLISDLLPVLDAFDGAVANGAEDVAPMRTSFLDALAKQGLERIDPADHPFDPNLHEAVMHEDAVDATDGPVVAEVMRAGYAWKGRVLRPAMVRTRG